MNREETNGRLETIVNGINSKNKLKKTFSYFGAVYFGGVLPEKYQRDFAEKIGWTSKKLTIYNAALMGGLTTLEYTLLLHFGERCESFIPQQIGNTFGIAYQTTLYSYIGFNVAQNLFRIGHAKVKKKGMASFSFMGGVIDLVYLSWKSIKKRCKAS